MTTIYDSACRPQLEEFTLRVLQQVCKLYPEMCYQDMVQSIFNNMVWMQQGSSKPKTNAGCCGTFKNKKPCTRKAVCSEHNLCKQHLKEHVDASKASGKKTKSKVLEVLVLDNNTTFWVDPEDGTLYQHGNDNQPVAVAQLNPKADNSSRWL